MSDIHAEYRDFVAFMMKKDGVPMPIEFICLGLVGELGELIHELNAQDIVKVEKELGDFIWYLTALRLSVGVFPLSGATGELALSEITARICELVKKHAWHGAPLAALEVSDLIATAWRGLDEMAERLELPIEQIKKTNMDKLKARYPGGFTTGGGVR